MQRQARIAANLRDRRDMFRLVQRADFCGLRDADRHRLTGMNESRIETLEFALEQFRIDTSHRAINRMQTCAAGEIFRRTAFIFDHMRFAMDERYAARTVDAGERQGVGRRACADKEDRDFTLEQFVETLFHAFVDFAGAIGCSKSICMKGKTFSDFRVGACPIV